MRLWIRNVAFLLLIGSSLGILGLLSGEFYRLLGLLCFLLFVATFRIRIRTLRGVRYSQAAAALGALLAGILFLRFADLGIYHFYFAVLLGALALISRDDSQNARQLGTYVIALAGIGLLAELVRLVPVLWHAEQWLASVLSFVSERIVREERNLGPTAMSLPLLLSLIVLALVRLALAEHPRRFRRVFALGVLIIAHMLYLVLLTPYAGWITTNRPLWQSLILNSQHLFVIVGSIAFTLVDRDVVIRPLRITPITRPVGVPIVLLAAGILFAAILGWAPSPSRDPARVMIYDAGYVDWRIPAHGIYGERSAGMFGMLPSTLEAVGFDVVVSDDLSRLGGPDPPDCIVMINIQTFFDDDIKKRIWDYIDRGGGLLCLGDHTGVAGIRGPFNDLLEPAGIRFEFDSSTFLGTGWNDALVFRPHPMNRSARNAEDFQVWVGATLDLDISARPVVVARYGYSDIGDPANIERSYLGDRRYNPGELLGDAVLVADARYGHGRIMVFGDTSGYQNLSFAKSLDTVAGSLHYLAAGGGVAPRPGFQVVALVLLLIIVAGTILHLRTPIPIVVVALGLALGSAAVRIATPEPPRLIPHFRAESPEFSGTRPPHMKRELAILDASHGGRFTLKAWQQQSLGGFQLNLARNGYLPLVRVEFPYRELALGRGVFVLVAPTRRYNDKEMQAIEGFLTGGGTVIAAVGFEEADGARGLLERFGFAIAGIPLGKFREPFGAESDSLLVDFYEAWPVLFEPGADTEVLFTKWNQPVAVRRTVGKGEIIVVGDTSFFWDLNLESRDSFLMGNIEFLRSLTEVGGSP